MTVTCPGCGWGAEVPDEKLPSTGTQATCPKCKTKFNVLPPTNASPKSDFFCPKCGTGQTYSDICVKCGIVVAKFINRKHNEECKNTEIQSQASLKQDANEEDNNLKSSQTLNFEDPENNESEPLNNNKSHKKTLTPKEKKDAKIGCLIIIAFIFIIWIIVKSISGHDSIQEASSESVIHIEGVEHKLSHSNKKLSIFRYKERKLFDACTDKIKSNLVAPSTAEFAILNEKYIKIDGIDMYAVIIAGEAKNRFGVPLTSKYWCTTFSDGTIFTLDEEPR